jgi:ABC-type multidrug transport system fused ATPase/permease subunit
MDSASEEIVEDALTTASKGRTTITISHRLISICHADVIHVLNGGQVVESGYARRTDSCKMVGRQSLQTKEISRRGNAAEC